LGDIALLVISYLLTIALEFGFDLKAKKTFFAATWIAFPATSRRCSSLNFSSVALGSYGRLRFPGVPKA
jgi:hypothetical protein